jgi:malonyl-CoA O-methyltransferase
MRHLLRQLLKRAPAPHMLTSLEAYDRWAATYPPHAHNPLMQAEESAMIALMPAIHSRQIILDLAGGSGRYSRIAESHGAHAISLDNSAAMLAVNPCERRVLASLEALPFAESCADAVICGLAVGHVRALTHVFAEFSRVMKHGAWALISDFHPFIALNGAKRTFSADGRTYAVEHYPRLYSDFHAIAYAHDLTITAVLEPRLAQAGDQPVVLVLRLEKHGR